MSDRAGGASLEILDKIRWALLLLTVLGLVGTAVQLALERHWAAPWQIAPWAALGGITVALIVLLYSTNSAAVKLARIIAVVVLLVALVGVWQHFSANLDHGSGAGAHQVEETGEDDHSDEDEHSDDEDEHADEDEHSDDEDGDEGHDAAGEDVSAIDVLTGAAGHTPLLAPFALVQVALTLAAATIGLGDGSPTAFRRRKRRS